MRAYAKVHPHFWVGKTGRALRQAGGQAQLMALYLISNPHATMLGIYYLPIPMLAHGLCLTPEEAVSTLQTLAELDFCTFDEESEYIWVHEMARFQVAARLKPGDNRILGIARQLEFLPDLPFIPAFYTRYQQAFRLPSAESEIDIEPVVNEPASVLPSVDIPPPQAENPPPLELPPPVSEPEQVAPQAPEQAHQEPVSDFQVAVQEGLSKPKASTPEPVIAVFNHWKEVCQHPNAQIDSQRRQCIQDALTLGYTVEQCCAAINGCAQTPYYMGHNERGIRFDGLHTIFKNADRIDQLIYHHQHPPKPSKNHHNEAETAWKKATEMASRVGAQGDIRFDDPKVMPVIQAFGGWRDFCHLPSNQLPFIKKRFMQHYQQLAQ
jgi:hypothetical protein